MWQPVIDVINRYQRFVLTTHLQPDGDGLGSEIALYHFLRSLNKEVLIINNDPLPTKYDYLDPENVMLTYSGQSILNDLLDFEVLFVLDNSFRHRLGRTVDIVDLDNILTVSIDHHAFHGELGTIRILDEETSAIGEMIYDLIKEMNGTVTLLMAMGLYTSLLTDTHHFSWPSTNGNTFALARELVEIGVEPDKIHELVYERNKLSQTKLLGRMLTTAQTEFNDLLAWGYVDYAMFQEAGLGPEDADYFPDFLRNIEKVTVAVLFKEFEPEVVSISLRSRGEVNVGQLADDFGGGGHNDMAGMIINGELGSVTARVLDAFRQLMVIDS